MLITDTTNSLILKKSSLDQLLKLFLIVALILAVVIFFLKSINYVGSDEGSYIYEVQLIQQGQIPLRDFISRAPSLIYTLEIFFQFIGSSIYALKLINLFFIIAIASFVYLIVRQQQSTNIALFAAFISLINPAFFLTKLVVNTTNISILFILAACYLIRLNFKSAHIFTGCLLALAVFTREINAIFVASLLTYLIFSKQFGKTLAIVLGGLLISLPTIGYFGYYIGIEKSAMTLLGLAHVKVKESAIDSSWVQNFFYLSLVPIGLALFLQKKDFSKFGSLYPEICWIISSGIFYYYYSSKRTFFLSYGSEFVPLLSIVAFSSSIFLRTTLFKSIYISTLFASVLATSIFPYFSIRPLVCEQYDSRRPLTFGNLIGSGIPIANFIQINQVINKFMAQDNSQILAGNLAFASENKLDQFMNLSRPMAYERDSMVYEMYNAPSRQQIYDNMLKSAPKIIVSDHHLKLSLWKTIQEYVIENYSLVYSDNYAQVYLKN